MTFLFDKKKIDRLGAILIKKKESIAVAESVTAGYMQAAIAAADNAIQFFQGGITTYNIGQKSKHLLIEPIHAAACNCVSQQTADEMALNVCDMFRSTWGIAVTGYASPVPESDNKTFCYYAIAHNKKILKRGMINIHEKSEALDIQIAYVNKLIPMLLALNKE
jgi:nicotinamide-nucleotide amidase